MDNKSAITPALLIEAERNRQVVFRNLKNTCQMLMNAIQSAKEQEKQDTEC